MNKAVYLEEADKILLHTYQRYQILLDKGEGVYLYDTEGKQYLDFASGIAVFALGYYNEEYNAVLKEQIDKLIHTSNLFYNVPAIEAAKKLASASELDRVFFTNSGTEAIEGALKLAKKYAYLKEKRDDYEIIAMNHSFHGRSLGALSVTGNPKYQEPFGPLIGGIRFAEFNNLDSVIKQISDRTCAVILEPVQGEGGIYPAEKEFLQGLRDLCTQKDILLIFDEIQCGMGRTGSMFAWQDYGIKPDIMTAAKALGCGIPVGAFIATEKAAAAMVPGDHGTTYGGNPLACAAVNQVFTLYEKYRITDHVKEISAYLEQELDKLIEKSDMVEARRGKGLMQGLVLNQPAGPIVQKALEQGLIVITAGPNVLRLVPPLIIAREHVDEMIKKLEASMEN